MPHDVFFAKGWELRICCGMNLERIWCGMNLEQGHDTGVFLDALFAKLEVLGRYLRHPIPAGRSTLE